MSEESQPAGFTDKVLKLWPILVGTVAFLAWAIASIAAASVNVATAETALKDHSDKIEKVSKSVDNHKHSGDHPRTNERLIKLESEVKHIQNTQTQNFKDIKKQLTIMQQDIKTLPR
jgi:TolA-binding protein